MLCRVRLVYRKGTGARPGSIRISPADAARLGVAGGDEVPVHMGSWQGRFRIDVDPAAGVAVVAMPQRGPRLPIRETSLYRHPNGELHLGPLIGIMTLFTKKRSVPANNQMSTYVELMRRTRALNGFAFVFQPKRTTAQRSWVRGWVRLQRRWISGRFPLPDVVYNRVQSRPLERRLRASGLMRRFEARGIPLFNAHYLVKWNVHRRLEQVPDVRRHLPETRPLRSLADVQYILERHGRAFLKPSNGTLGLGAMLLVRNRDGTLDYRMNTLSGRKRAGTLRSLAQLRRVLPRRRDYLAQQGIPLAQYQGRPFDVRALVQKDSDGRWHFSGAAARVAGPGRVTTHVPRGGSRRPLRVVLEAAFGPDRVAEITRNLRAVCLQAAAALEASTGERFGEFSLDVGIDRDGEAWILEMNAKPFRFDELRLRECSQRRLVRYACSLAGAVFPPEDLEDGSSGTAEEEWVPAEDVQREGVR